MSKKSEAKLWNLVKKLNNKYYFERIESPIGRGVPDVHGVIENKIFWLELKANSSKNYGISKWQINWHVDYQRAGGLSFILVAPLKERGLKLLAVNRDSRLVSLVTRTSSRTVNELELALRTTLGLPPRSSGA